MKKRLGLLFGLLLCLGHVDRLMAADRVYHIMPVGDSITQLNLYRYWLWEKLVTAGYQFEFVGSGSTDSRVGPLAHEGHGGKNAEFAASVLAASLHDHPTDILLIHAGHNHSYETKPVPGIVAATEQMIADGRASNPKMIVLLAQVIPSGKLPKYSYIPELNTQLAGLANRLNTPDQPVVIVNQAEGFDPATDTVGDHVHPNVQGAQKMANKWLDALATVLDKPATSYSPKIVTYRKLGDVELTLHIFNPPAESKAAKPAVLFFAGEAWTYGSPLEVYPDCARLAREGYVAIAVDYRLAYKNKTSPFDSVTDAKSAVRWVRQHAAEIGVNPSQVVAAGFGTGGHVAAAAGTSPGLDDPTEDAAVSSRPNALLLINPPLDVSPQGYGNDKTKDGYKSISPIDHVDGSTPPTLVLLDPEHPLTSPKTAATFQTDVQQAGGRCEVVTLPGTLPSYVYPQRNKAQLTALDDMLEFLARTGFAPSAK